MVLKYLMKKLKRILMKPFRMRKRATKQPTPPEALREQVWLKVYGKAFSNTCYVKWHHLISISVIISPRAKEGQTQYLTCPPLVVDATYQ